MKSCENIRKIGAYHDGELPEAKRRELEQHLSGCAACRRELERLRALSRWLASARQPEVPAEVLRRLRESIQPRRERVLLRTAGTLTAAAAAVLLVCSAMLWQRWDAPPEIPREAWERAALVATSPETEGSDVQSQTETETDVDVELIQSILEP